LLPFLTFESFPSFIESHGVFYPIIFEQTQDMHYSSPIPICGLQTQGGQYDARRTFAHTILCPIDALTLKKIAELFSHKTNSHLSLSWPMHYKLLLWQEAEG